MPGICLITMGGTTASFLFSFWSLLLLVKGQSFMDVEEFCERDTFNPTCQEDEVILIKHAEYGRMREGRCISRAYGVLRCSINVQSILDSKCSGRRQCEVIVATLVPENLQPCPTDFRGYLEVSYECVRVAYAHPKFCQPSGVIELRQTRGYLSSLVTEETNCGSVDSPWWLSVKPGQTINLTLLDFEASRTIETRGTCQVYAVIKEESLSTSETVCASSVREKHVYTSKSNVVEVRILGKKNDAGDKHSSFFLIKYEAVGCPDPIPPIQGWVKRINNEIVIGCNSTGTTPRWKMHCENNQWIGSYKNCTEGAAIGKSSMGGLSTLSDSHGLSILIIVAIACLVGLGILLFGLIYLKKKRNQRDRTRTTHSDYSADLHSNYKASDYQPHGMSQNMSKSSDNLGSYQSSAENDYYRTWQLQRHSQLPIAHMQPPFAPKHTHNPLPLPPSAMQYYGPTEDRTGTGPGIITYNSENPNRYSEHIYESPNFERKEFAPQVGQRSDTGIPTEYFELDPESPTNPNIAVK